MAVTVVELPQSRPRWWGQTKTCDLIYRITGTADEATAGSNLESTAPSTHDGLIMLDYGVEPEYIDTASPSRCRWKGTVRYGIPSGSAPEPLEVGDIAISGGTRGGTQHITVPISQTGYVAAGSVPDAHGIGDDGKGNVEGVDIAVAVSEWEVTKVFATAGAAPSPNTLWALTATVNDDTFSAEDSKTSRQVSFAAGECLFLGHSEGRARVDGALEIRYYFAGSPNRTSIAIPNTGITVTTKPGWDYLWLRFQEEEDDTAKVLYAKALAAYVSKVYRDGDFTDLDI